MQRENGRSRALVCARCKSAHYCSRECQIEDWQRGHKALCKLKREEPAEPAPPAIPAAPAQPAPISTAPPEFVDLEPVE